MKKYEEMTKEEITRINRIGGDEKRKLNNIVGDFLENLSLSQIARDFIAQTDGQSLSEIYGGMFTAEEVESWTLELVADDVMDWLTDVLKESATPEEVKKNISCYINDFVEKQYSEKLPSESLKKIKEMVNKKYQNL